MILQLLKLLIFLHALSYKNCKINIFAITFYQSTNIYTFTFLAKNNDFLFTFLVKNKQK